MTRRAALAMLAGQCGLRADARQEILDLLYVMAAALAAGDAPEFLRYCEGDLRDHVRLLVVPLAAQADVTSSVELLKAGETEAEADWYMEIKVRAPGGRTERRRQVIAVKTNAKRTRVTGLKPLEFFAPLT